MWVQMTRLIGLPCMKPPNSVSQCSREESVAMQVSTTVQPSSSSSSQRLMWSRDMGMEKRSQYTPSAMRSGSPWGGPKRRPQGY